MKLDSRFRGNDGCDRRRSTRIPARMKLDSRPRFRGDMLSRE